MNWAIPQVSAGPVHPEDERHLARYAQGEITSREVVRRVLRRLGEQVPESLVGERRARPESTRVRAVVGEVIPAGAVVHHVPEPLPEADPLPGSTMSDDTAAFARGDLDLTDWLTRAERKYGRLPARGLSG